jgi:hypothetical protein
MIRAVLWLICLLPLALLLIERARWFRSRR